MTTLQGKYNTAEVFTDNIEETAVEQIIELCNQEFTKDLTIRIMPDTHAGAGCTIGTVMTITDKVVPNLVGVDIGCGMNTTQFTADSIDLAELDNAIRALVPSGFAVRNKPHSKAIYFDVSRLRCIEHIENKERILLSIGTLGGGNHFIEVSKGNNSVNYLIVHSGSRNLGKQIAEYYQKVAIATHPNLPPDLAYVEGEDLTNYLNDMAVAQHYAELNRNAITEEICSQMKWNINASFETIHNYIDINTKILRKGAISANAGETAIIPINMRDGSLIVCGHGNEDWLYSAPHGAGRVMSRSQAKKKILLNDFEDSMKGIWTTSVSKDTIDECPMAYKPMSEIIENIKDTCTVIDIVKPLYNFKADETRKW